MALSERINRNLAVLRVMERALHEGGIAWAIETNGVRVRAEIEISDEGVLFRASVPRVGDTVTLYANGEPVLFQPVLSTGDGAVEWLLAPELLAA